ncbi:endonuclease/exonuclease/phosphatase family protein [Actinoplanes sp. NPDC024001]|uniref:endonuclease/exonuclease/phosphatase family protein n=1 Tax=Actinoplanes sp. NPDC024001 TaxID=3154598 RepID=UPI0033CEB8A4
MRLRMTKLLAALALAVTPLTVAQPASAATTETLTVWHWNVSGWVMNDGSTTNGMVDGLVASILNRDADFVALNEICWDQYKAVQARLADAGWPQTTNYSRFEAALPTVCNGEAFGNAIFSRQPLGTADRVALTADPQDGGEVRNLLCAPVVDKKLRFCVTHLTPYSKVVTQLNEVRARVEAWEDAGDTVLIAGDLNTEPSYDRLNSWYSSSVNTVNNPGNWGRHRELDDTDPVCPGYGEGTTSNTTNGKCGKGSKIDMVFVPENRIAGSYFGDSLSISTACGGPCSDHRIFYGRVTVSVG